MIKLLTKNTEETKKIGAELAADLQGGEILALSGELGAGKTTLIQGLAGGLGIKEAVTSPTFILLSLYKLPKTLRQIKYLAHVDAYRLKNSDEALGVGLTDYLAKPDTVTVIEWAEKFEKILKNYQTKNIYIKSFSPTNREIIISESKQSDSKH